MKSTVSHRPRQGAGPRVRHLPPPVGTVNRHGTASRARAEPGLAGPLSLRRNFSWTVAGNAVEMAAQWGLLVVLAHLCGMETVGLVVLAFAVCSPVNALAYLGLRGAVVTDARGEYQFGDYLAVRLVTALLALVVVAGIVLTTIDDPTTAWVTLAVGAGETFKAASDIFHALLQQHERMDRIAVSQIVRGLGTLVALALAVYVTRSIAWGAWALPLVSALTLFAYDLPGGVRIAKAAPRGGGSSVEPEGEPAVVLAPRWEPRTMLRLAWLTLPLGIVLMLIALNTSIPRYMIDHYLGKRSLGVFVSIFYLGMIAVRVVSALGQSAGPRLAKYHAAGDTAAYGRLLAKLLGLVSVLGAGMVLVVAAAGEPILRLLYQSDFTPHLRLAIVLTIAAAALCLTIPLGIAIEAMRRFKTHMAIRGVGVLVLVAVLPRLIEAAGLEGAAIAMLLSSGCSVLGCGGAILWAVASGSRHGALADESGPACVVEAMG